MSQPTPLPTETIRAFVGIDFESESLRHIARLQAKLLSAPGASNAAWVPADKIHLTLKFMSALGTGNVERIGEGLRSAAEAMSRPELGVVALDGFPDVSRARVIVLQFEDPTGAVRELARRVEQLAAEVGVPAEERAFRPHSTLARLRRPLDARNWLRPQFASVARILGDCRPARVTLYRSILGSEASKYIPIVSYGFASS